MESYEKTFLELLKYSYFIKDEKVKIKRFLSGLPESYGDKIQYDRPRNLRENTYMNKIREMTHIKRIGRV